MSGGPYFVGGIEVARTSDHPLADEMICSVFYQMAEFASDDVVRESLQSQISHGGALHLPPVSVSNAGDPNRNREATITGGPLQVKIPFASLDPGLALDTRDVSICVAIVESTSIIQDAVLRTSAQNGARAGLERITEVFGQHVAPYQALGLAEIAQNDGFQITWNNVRGIS